MTATLVKNLTAAVSFGGLVFPVTDSGTYSLNSDCTGSAFFPSAGETWNLVVTSGGKQIHTMIATSGRVLAGDTDAPVRQNGNAGTKLRAPGL